MAGEREHVAIFNPLTLPLPAWHPDGPDGTIDGFVIPFVMPAPSAGLQPNRHARINVYADDAGRWAAILSNVYMAGSECVTADQARALAGAWIRAAELLDNVGANKIVDAEVVEDDQPDPDQCFFCEARAVVDRPWGWQCTECGQWDVAQGKSRCKSRHDGSGRCIESAEHDGPCRFAADVDDVR